MKNVIVDIDNNVSDSLKIGRDTLEIGKGIFHSKNFNRYVSESAMQRFKWMSPVSVIMFTNLKAARTVSISREYPANLENANDFFS